MDKILAIDDEVINLMMVRRILGEQYEVKTVSSGEEALQTLREFEADMILLDIHMPGINGFEAFEYIRKIEGMEQVPIIFLTADDDADNEIKGFEMGADDFIKKPFVSAVVKRRVARSMENYHLHCNLQSEVAKQTQTAENRRRELEVISVEIIQTLAAAIDAKDIYTKGHSTRVAEYAALLAVKMGWDEVEIEKLRYKALLHDVGKIGIPDRVLNKNGHLSNEEFEIIKSHTAIGAEILKGVSSLSTMHEVAKSHHERYDGKGYPEGLSGTDIPKEARLVCIADAYDAMSSDRVYRKALGKEKIREELVKGKGTQFDPEMLDIFLEMFDSGELDLTVQDSDSKETINVASALRNILQQEAYVGALKLERAEMTNLYAYISNIHSRYGIEYNTILISLTWDGDISEEDVEQGMQAMEYSITQSLRKVDVTTKISSSQFLLVLTEAYEENIQIIVDRIFAGFYRNCLNVRIKPVYEIQ